MVEPTKKPIVTPRTQDIEKLRIVRPMVPTPAPPEPPKKTEEYDQPLLTLNAKEGGQLSTEQSIPPKIISAV
jgi:hypothetical protein